MASPTPPIIRFLPSPDPGQSLEWGATAFAASCSENSPRGDLYRELAGALGEDLGERIFLLALLHIAFPQVPDSRIGSAFRRSFLSVLHPDVNLDRGALDILLNAGESFSAFRVFLTRHCSRHAGPDLFLDSILRTPAAVDPDCLGDYTLAPEEKNLPTSRILYAYSLHTLEPLLSGCLPQNSSSPICYRDFLSFFRIPEATALTDEREYQSNEGFLPHSLSPYSRYLHLEDPMYQFPDSTLHILKSVSPETLHLSEAEIMRVGKPLPGIPDVWCRQTPLDGEGTWLYRFRTRRQAEEDERLWLRTHSYSSRSQQHRLSLNFGTLLVASSREMDPLTVYRAVRHRQKMRMLMHSCRFPSDMGPAGNREYVLIGREMVNFISAVITARMVETLEESSWLDTRTVSDILTTLRDIRLLRGPHRSSWRLDTIGSEERDLLLTLNLIPDLSE